MAKVGGYNIGSIYQGGYSSLEPNYGNVFTGYRAKMADLGVTTHPQKIDIMTEVSQKIAPGNKSVELSLIQPQIMEAVPNQYFEETKRLSEITGTEVTVHGPLVDASGMKKEGWDESEREKNVRQMIHAMNQAHKINPKKSLPVTFHSTNALPGSVFSKDKEGKEVWDTAFVINQETGQLQQVKRETKYYPGKDPNKPEELSVQDNLRAMNNTEWSNSLYELEARRENAERILQDVHPVFRGLYLDVASGKRDPKTLSSEENEQINKIISAREFVDQAHLSANGLFHKAYKYARNDEEKEYLKKLSEGYAEELKANEEKGKLSQLDPKTMSSALFHLSQGLKRVKPEIYKMADEFSIEKAGQSFGEVAWQSWKKHGDNSPIVSVENPPAGQHSLARGEDLKNLVERSRKEFIKKAKSKGMSESKAKEKAEKLIGVTWDVGHINMVKRYGFDEKDVIKETEKIAPYLKHVHLSDNFGLEHTELPMGMGNVPLKQMMKKLGKKGEQANKIVEASAWWTNLQKSPLYESFEGLGTPLYGGDQAPYWNQSVGFQQGYSMGYGMMLPQQNYNMFGAGFSQLPQELGGQAAGGQGNRMSGRGME